VNQNSDSEGSQTGDCFGKYRILRNVRNLQNRNSAAAEIAIRFGPKILLKCSVRKTGPKYPTIGLDDGYKSSFSLNHKLNRSASAFTVAFFLTDDFGVSWQGTQFFLS
jgi:hypothetical protein